MGILDRLFGPPDIEKFKQKRDVNGLIRALSHQESKVRQIAVEALGDIRDAGAVGPLIFTLKDADLDVRRSAKDALCKIGTPAVEQLIAALIDQDSNVRENAVHTLGKIRDVSAVEPLLAVLKDKDSNVRKWAAWALGEIGNIRAIEPLIAALKDKGWESDLAVKPFVKMGTPVVEPLIATLKDNRDPHVRKEAAKALGDIGDARAVEPLIVALKDKDSYVQLKVVVALETIDILIREKNSDDSCVVESLISALKNESSSVRGGATLVLWSMRRYRKGAHNALIEAYADKDLRSIANNYSLYLKKKSGAEMEDLLIMALLNYGTDDMARDYHKSGNSLLWEAVAKWEREKDSWKFNPHPPRL